MEQKKLKKIIEAALFMSPKPVNLEDFAKISNTTVAEIRVALNELIHDFEERDSSLEILDTKSGVKMDVKEEFKENVSAFAASPELNKSVMKTLAYISFKQPVKQTEVIRFRNNKAYEHIKILEEQDFIKRESFGRSYIIYTTKKFLGYFGNQKKIK